MVNGMLEKNYVKVEVGKKGVNQGENQGGVCGVNVRANQGVKKL